jgi:hypothetical protein
MRSVLEGDHMAMQATTDDAGVEQIRYHLAFDWPFGFIVITQSQPSQTSYGTTLGRRRFINP